MAGIAIISLILMAGWQYSFWFLYSISVIYVLCRNIFAQIQPRRIFFTVHIYCTHESRFVITQYLTFRINRSIKPELNLHLYEHVFLNKFFPPYRQKFFRASSRWHKNTCQFFLVWWKLSSVLKEARKMFFLDMCVTQRQSTLEADQSLYTIFNFLCMHKEI